VSADRLVDGYRARYQSQVTASSTAAVAEPLGVREHEILNLIAQGQSDKETARILCISPETVKSHFLRLGRKIDVGAACRFHCRCHGPEPVRHALTHAVIDAGTRMEAA
jgi:DNA-binding CsgD family transcriptional regulator